VIVLQSGLVFHPKTWKGKKSQIGNQKIIGPSKKECQKCLRALTHKYLQDLGDTFFLSAHIVITGYAHKNSAKSKSSAKKLNS